MFCPNVSIFQFYSVINPITKLTHPRNCILDGPSEMIRLASPSPSTSGGGVANFWGLTRRQVMRVGAAQVRGGMITRRPWCLLPLMEPPRASTMKLTRKLWVTQRFNDLIKTKKSFFNLINHNSVFMIKMHLVIIHFLREILDINAFSSVVHSVYVLCSVIHKWCTISLCVLLIWLFQHSRVRQATWSCH